MSGSSDAKTLIQTADSASNAFSSVNFEDVKEAAKVGGEVGLVLAGVGVGKIFEESLKNLSSKWVIFWRSQP